MAKAGFKAIAPDMRGYGGTKGPADPEAYTNLHAIGDMVALLDALGIDQAVIVGHDWGSPIAWGAATLRPDRFRAVASLSVMHNPRMPMPPPDFAKANGMEDLYWLYFQPPGQAEADMERDTRETFLRLMYGVSGEAAKKGDSWDLRVDPKVGLVAALKRPDKLPSFLTEEDLTRYAHTYARTGFTTSLNWYRCMARSWQHSAAWADVKISVPAFFIGGKDDPTLGQFARGTEVMRSVVPNLRDGRHGRCRALGAAGRPGGGEQRADRVHQGAVARASGCKTGRVARAGLRISALGAGRPRPSPLIAASRSSCGAAGSGRSGLRRDTPRTRPDRPASAL